MSGRLSMARANRFKTFDNNSLASVNLIAVLIERAGISGFSKIFSCINESEEVRI